MSASPQPSPEVPRSPDVLGELLHSLSQPLTGLRCSLELSLERSLEISPEELAEQRQESVAAALEQTENVIAMVQLMREYLDAEQPAPETCAVALAPAARSVVEELATIAEVRGIEMRLVGTCTATVPVPEARLRLALQYLIATTMEAQPAGGKVTLLLGEDAAGAVLRAEGERNVRELEFRRPDFCELNYRDREQGATSPPVERDATSAITSSASTLRRVRLAIASRVLNAAGASLVFGDGDSFGFVLRVPH